MFSNKNKLSLHILLGLLLFSFFQTRSFAQTFSTKSSATFPVPLAPARAIVADFDNDGDADILYQTGANGTVFRFAKNNGDGTFTDQAISASPFANVTLVDDNGSNYHVADYDKDGDMDLWAGVNNSTGSYYRNDNGTFSLQSSATFPAPAASGRATAGDFDHDGDADFLYQSAGNGSAFKYARNNGNGTFTDVPIASSPFAGLTLPDNNTFNYQVADFDADGDVDLWVGANGGTGSYFRNDGTTFSSQSSATFPAPGVISRAVICDFDTDGDADILYQTGGDGTAFQYARNNGNGTFTIVAQSLSPFASVTLIDNSGYSYYIGDFDHDGDIDVWAAKVSSSASSAFYSKDASPPQLVSFTPANNASGVSPSVNITYTFDQSVVKGIGNISIVRTSDNTVVEAIPVNSTQVTGSGTTYTIDPSITLAASTQYAVKSDAGSFKNSDGVIFAGVSLSNVQSFKTASALNSVTVPANGTYKTGDNLNFSVNYSENITVTGSPFIPITIGSTVRNASYLSGSGTAVLVFRYIVVAGDLDNDGIAVGSTISLNGGTLKDQSNANAPLTLNSVGSTTGVLVDAVSPSITSITPPGNGNYTTGQFLNFTVNWSDVVNVNTSGGTPSIPVTIGSTVRNASYVSGTGTTALIFRYTVVAADQDVDGITVSSPVALNGGTIKDAAGNDGVLTFTSPNTSGVLVNSVVVTTYYPKTTATDLSQTNNWTDAVSGTGGTSPTNFNSANQLFNINTNAPLAGTLDFSGGSNMEINGATLTITPAGRLSINAGSTGDFKSNHVILRSDTTGTASIGAINGTLSNATNVTVERFISSYHNRAYRLLGPSVNTTTTIHANWQENAASRTDNPNPGYGTHITGTLVDQTNGFDATQTGQGSLFTYINTPAQWVAANNTNISTLNGKTGYLLYVRGDRSMNLDAPQSALLPGVRTTLRATGTLLQNTQIFGGLAGNDFSLVTNPYASSIDWSSIYTNNSSSFENYYTYWDPNIGSRGGYVTVASNGTGNPPTVSPDPSITPVPTPAGNLNIQSGQAFFVKAKVTEPFLTIREIDKSTTNNIDVFRTTSPASQKFTISLYYTDAEHGRRLADGVTSLYDDSYNKNVDGNDAEEINNWDENIAIASGGKHLSIEERPTITASDTLSLFMSNMKQQVYEFEFNPSNLNPNTTAQLVDNFTGNKTYLDVTSKTVVPFTVISATASSAADRFYILFKTSTALPVTLTSIKAYQKNTGIAVEWTTQQESNIDHYEVERSQDGQQFAKIGSNVAAKNSSTVTNYSLFDATPFRGLNYYRIKIIDKSGQVTYSSIVKVTISSNSANFVTVYPNPLSSNVITLQMNLAKGSYTISLTNKLGQLMTSKVIEYPGGSSTQTITPSQTFAAGVYQLKVTGNDINITQQVIKN